MEICKAIGETEYRSQWDEFFGGYRGMSVRETRGEPLRAVPLPVRLPVVLCGSALLTRRYFLSPRLVVCRTGALF